MQIEEAKIFHFGGLHDRTFRFAPGVNVIYGENEAGKSTLAAFLTGMLFGIEKGRGKSVQDAYRRYEPWDAPSFYSGALRFTVDGKPFYLERNFYSREVRERLFNEADGEELSVACGDLSMLLGGIRKNDFIRTCFISQSGAAGVEFSDILAEYYADAAGSGEGNIPIQKAVQALHNRRKELNADLKNIENEREKRLHDCRMEQALLEREAASLRAQITRMEQELPEREAADAARETPQGRGKTGGRLAFLLAVFALVFASCGGFLAWKTAAFSAAVCGLSAVAVFCGAAAVGLICRTFRRHAEEGETESGSRDDMQEADGWKAAQKLLEGRKDSLREMERRLFDLREKENEIAAKDVKERKLLLDMAALDLAAQEIERISCELVAERGAAIRKEIQELTAKFTGNRYQSVRLDENGKIFLSTNGKEVPPEALSRGTLEQIYLAFRLAVGKMITREEPMPIFLDEAFAQYDDRRLSETLDTLAGLGEQIFLFTCQRREGQILTELGVPFYEIRLPAGAQEQAAR